MNLRLLWLTENYFPNRGGMAQSCDRIVHQLRQQGVNIDVIHFSTRKKPYHWQKQAQGRYLACPFEEDSAHTLNRLWQFLQDEQTVYTHFVAFGGNLPVMAASVLPACLQLPLVSLFRGNDLDAALFSARRQPVLLKVLQQSAAVATVSRDKVAKIRSLCPEAKVFYTPNGIDTRQWQLSPSDREKAAGWKRENADGRKVIGLFGHLKAKKGVPFFLEALQRSGISSRVHLLMVGHVGESLQDMLNNQPQISYSCLPFMDRYELLGYYPACDAIAIPSFYDGMPNVMLEAGALGIPLIAAQVDGMKDLLADEPEEFGWLFKAAKLPDAADCLKSWSLASPQEISRRAENCRQRILEHYHQEKEAANYLEILIKTLRPL
ncbi:MAG: glycosyltransferase family 4 protein [Cyclobacteriaceae bacterium]